MLTGKKAAIFAFLLAGIFVCVGSPGFSLAAQPEGRTKGQGGDLPLYTMPAVTVTVDKREVEVQKVPMTVSVMTAQDIEDANIKTVNDVLQHIPSLSVNRRFGGATMMSFRGAVSSQGTEASPIVIYIDGVPVDTHFNLDANLMDVERIEVLRGPQSVMYGKNALGGIVNIISKKPGNDWRGKVFSRVETDDGLGFGAMISGPIAEDKLFFSLSAQHDYAGGYMDSPYRSDNNKTRTERVKGQLRAAPTDKSEFAFHFDYTAKRDGFTPWTFGESTSMTTPAPDSDHLDSDILNFAFTGKMEGEHAIAESVTTFRHETLDYAVDFTGAAGLGLGDGGRDTTRKEVTQEFRLRSPDEQPGVAWLAGLYGSYSDLNHKKIYSEFTPIDLGGGFVLNPYTNQPYREYTKELAAFGQIEIPLTDALKATMGLRWHYTHRNSSINYKTNADAQLLGMDPMALRIDDSWSEWLPKFNLSYQLTDDHMIYAGVSRSFIPGGFNYVATSGKRVTYDSQTAWNYEAGAKTAWLGNKLIANLTLYYSDYKDMQSMAFDLSTRSYSAENAASARSYGAELDVSYELLHGLTAMMSAGYTNAKYEEFEVETSTGAANYSGNRIMLTPKYTATFGLRYRHDNGFMAMTEVFYRDKLYWDEGNTASRSDVATVNGRIGYEGENFDFYVYGNNIFGKRYMEYYSPSITMGMTAPIQNFGMEIAYRF